MRKIIKNEWHQCHIDDLWIFDKLILSKKLGYECGPKGTSVPKPDYYIIRPCVNLMGMGRGAYIQFLEEDTDDVLPEGTFWCELFKGRHLSVDFYRGKQVLCVEGYRSSDNLSKWDKWEKKREQIEFPKIVKTFKGKYDWINIEMINDNIIEVHLRNNPDFEGHNAEYIIPVYEDSISLEGHTYIEAQEYIRLGFLIPDQCSSILTL